MTRRLILVALAATCMHAPGAAADITHFDRAEFPAPVGESDAAGPLAPSACATVAERDDVEHETSDRSAAKIKVIELVAADREPSLEARNLIQRRVSQIIHHIGLESGGRKSVRFDLGTVCGARYADIQSVRLPHPNAHYESNCLTTIFDEVRERMGEAAGPRNALLFATTFGCGTANGFANMPADDTPGPGNIANRGGYFAITYTTWFHTAEHELGHTLGAVQSSAPHWDTTSHCWDNDDVLCYPYTQAFPTATPVLRPCAGVNPFPFDCGKDDYFSPAPAPGSYLATHWNTYDSVFMCPLAECVPEPAPAAPTAPATAGGPHASAPGSGPAAKPRSSVRRCQARCRAQARRRCHKVRGAAKRRACVKRFERRWQARPAAPSSAR